MPIPASSANEQQVKVEVDFEARNGHVSDGLDQSVPAESTFRRESGEGHGQVPLDLTYLDVLNLLRVPNWEYSRR